MFDRFNQWLNKPGIGDRIDRIFIVLLHLAIGFFGGILVMILYNIITGLVQ